VGAYIGARGGACGAEAARAAGHEGNLACEGLGHWISPPFEFRCGCGYALPDGLEIETI
jgi:hypothetical protein